MTRRREDPRDQKIADLKAQIAARDVELRRLYYVNAPDLSETAAAEARSWVAAGERKRARVEFAPFDWETN